MLLTKPQQLTVDILHCVQVRSMNGASLKSIRVNLLTPKYFSFTMQLFLPEGEGPFPIILNGDGCWRYCNDQVISEALSRGYGVALFNRTEFAIDIFTSDRSSGIYPHYPDSNFGALAAWAWAYQRCIDALELESQVDSKCISLTGHSRGGKTVLIAAATDERVYAVNPNDSGCGGAGSFKVYNSDCERIKSICENFSYWFSPNLQKYIDLEHELPLDQHFLISLIAPRPVISTEALGDLWANPAGTWQIHCASKEVYKWLGVPDHKQIHFREGDHSHPLSDWQVFLDFLDSIRLKKNQSISSNNPFVNDPLSFNWSAPK